MFITGGCLTDSGDKKDNTASSYTVSGKITDSQNKGIPGVTVVMATGETVQTDSVGSYSFTKVVKGSYTLTPTLNGYVFVPEKRDITVSGGLTGIDFTGSPSVLPEGEYNVSGKITDSSNNGISGVTITLYTGKTFKTTLTGLFIFTKIPSGNYTLTLSKDGYTFTPESRQFTVNNANVSGLNFTGTFTGSGGLLAENFFLLRKDTVMNFMRKIVSTDNPNVKTEEYYDTVTSATTHSGVTYMQVASKDKNTEATLKIDELRVADNVVWAYIWLASGKQSPALFKNGPSKVSAAGLPENPLYDFNKGVGETWEVYNNVNSETGVTSILNASFEGTENVTVTAGTFNNCAKFKFVLDVITDTGDSSTTYFNWIAPNVGRVKTNAVMTQNGQLYSSWVDDLTSYYVP